MDKMAKELTIYLLSLQGFELEEGKKFNPKTTRDFRAKSLYEDSKKILKFLKLKGLLKNEN